jgi:hypothetical protein
MKRTSEKTMTSTIHMTGINAINRRKMKVAMPSSTHIFKEVTRSGEPLRIDFSS